MKRHTLIPAPAGLAVLLTVLALPSNIASAQNIRYVAGSGTDAGACISQGSPCKTVSYALAQASAGDTIDIGGGVYSESSGLNIDKSINLQGAGKNGSQATTIRPHRFPDMASSRVITIDGEFEVSISDLVIQNGVADGLAEDGYGGGIYARNATLTLTNVIFRDNRAPRMQQAAGGNLLPAGEGGGLYNWYSALTLSHVEFVGNRASRFGGGLSNASDRPVILTDVEFDSNVTNLPVSPTFGGDGGGMYNASGSPTLNNVVFTNNFAGKDGGGLFNGFGSPTLVDIRFDGNQAGDLNFPGNGGGMYTRYDSQPSLTRVEFRDNYAHHEGGGLYLGFNGSALLKSVSFIDNIAINCGGAMSSSLSTPVVINGLFSGNLSTQDGGAICNDRSLVRITNSTIAGNHTLGFGGGLYNFQTAPSLANSIIWGNQADTLGNEMYFSVQGSFETVSISHSLYDNHPNDIILDVQGGAIYFDEVNVLHDDPLFNILAPPDDLRLTDSSPAINAGDPDTDLSLFTGGPDDPEDLDNSPRVHGGQIDMGAYEWGSMNDTIFHDRFEDL